VIDGGFSIFFVKINGSFYQDRRNFVHAKTRMISIHIR